jgi:dolichol-phosphate mannosyltransferase
MSLQASAEPYSSSLPYIACVIPCFKVREQILKVLPRIGPEVTSIFVVDDCCPQESGRLVQLESKDARVKVIFNSRNLGVGGAVLAGYHAALADGADIIVKIDGDNQMDPELLISIVAPILAGEADYVKGNRFFDPEAIIGMPFVRVFGNSCLSFLAKLSTGYWNLFDPTNGFTAIHARVAELLPSEKISQRYFFETDILFRLNSVGAVVVDLPMVARYGDEISNLSVVKAIPEFFVKHVRNTFKRIIYRYLLRDFSVATLELFVGSLLLLFGSVYGGMRWYLSANGILSANAGSVMLAALPVFVGIQLIIAFLNYDIRSVPQRPIHLALTARRNVIARLFPLGGAGLI